MSQEQSIDDLDEPQITAEEVDRRVDDWLRRLDGLFAEIKTWAKASGWSVEDGAPVPMREEPMERLGVRARQQPTLSVRSPGGAEVWIKPKGLWVIGANGRVDMYSRKGAFTLVDVADAFAPPRWILHRIGQGAGQPFEPGQIADMI